MKLFKIVLIVAVNASFCVEAMNRPQPVSISSAGTRTYASADAARAATRQSSTPSVPTTRSTVIKPVYQK